MITLAIRDLVRNAAAVFSGTYGAVTGRAEQAGCSRQTIYQHARLVEHQLDPACREAELSALRDENQRLRDRLAELTGQAERSVTCGPDELRRVATVAFACGVTLRQIEETLGALLPGRLAPDHSTIGRWVAAGAEKARAVLVPLDAACAARAPTLALDEVFFGGDRPWSGSSRPA